MMRNKFFFGVVVGFFVAVVAFVVFFLFFSGTVKARSVVPKNSPIAVVKPIEIVDVEHHVNDDLVAVSAVPQGIVDVNEVRKDVPNVSGIVRDAAVEDAVVVEHRVPLVEMNTVVGTDA